MFLNQIGLGSKVKIEFNMQNQKLEFETEVVRALEEKTQLGFTVICKSIRKDGKVINLKSKEGNFSVYISNVTDNRDYKWNAFYIANVRIDNETFLRISSMKEIKPLNRREYIRLPVGDNIVVQVGTNKKTLDGFLNNISLTGFGCTVLTTCDAKIGEHATVSYFNKELNHNFRFNGIVKRVEHLRAERVYIGCQLEGENDNNWINKLVVHQQVKQLKKQGRGLSLPVK